MHEIELRNDRLYLRPWRLGDAGQVFEACQDREIQRWTSVPAPYSQQDAVSFVGTYAPRGWQEGTRAVFGAFDAAGERLLASVGLDDICERNAQPGGRAELGYWCAPWARGTGVTTEAARMVCEWAFGGLGLARIDWYAEVGNHASRRVAEKLGFTIEGVQRQRLVHKGERRDGWAGGLLRGELI